MAIKIENIDVLQDTLLDIIKAEKNKPDHARDAKTILASIELYTRLEEKKIKGMETLNKMRNKP